MSKGYGLVQSDISYRATLLIGVVAGQDGLQPMASAPFSAEVRQ